MVEGDYTFFKQFAKRFIVVAKHPPDLAAPLAAGPVERFPSEVRIRRSAAGGIWHITCKFRLKRGASLPPVEATRTEEVCDVQYIIDRKFEPVSL
jgi:hypothetical protein